jgi:hypothetical protein
MDNTSALRAQLHKLLDWHDAHVPFSVAIAYHVGELVLVRRYLGNWDNS